MSPWCALVPALQWSLFLLCPELEAIAANAPPNKPFVMSPSEAKFIAYLITRHGTNYKVGIEQVLNAHMGIISMTTKGLYSVLLIFL